MAKSYQIPMNVSVALSTERVMFLHGMTDKELIENADCVQLLCDLIDDRVKLRHMVQQATDAMYQHCKHADATYNKLKTLGDVLDGKENDEEGDDDDATHGGMAAR